MKQAKKSTVVRILINKNNRIKGNPSVTRETSGQKNAGNQLDNQYKAQKRSVISVNRKINGRRKINKSRINNFN